MKYLCLQCLITIKFPGASASKRFIESDIYLVSDSDKERLKQAKEIYGQANSYREELQNKTPEEIANLYEETFEKLRKEQLIKQENEEKARFFNHFSANAGFEHWSKMTSWTIDAFVALSLGKDPRIVTWEKVYPHRDKSPFAKKI